ncbi:hypothetical protein, partial [Serratia marcescens]|uniref:hypothetical protein n=1 Tax=Serratia marcescens TaxID=615 RepID=UPI001952CB10
RKTDPLWRALPLIQLDHIALRYGGRLDWQGSDAAADSNKSGFPKPVRTIARSTHSENCSETHFICAPIF